MRLHRHDASVELVNQRLINSTLALHAGLAAAAIVLAACGEVAPPVAPSPSPSPITLREPFDVIEERGGTLLIADRKANAIYRRRGEVLTVVANVPAPRDLEPDGSRVLVASGRNVLSLDVRSGATEVVGRARAEVLGIARTDEGIAVSDGSRVTLDDRVLARGLDGAHGLLSTPDGLVVCESFAGRVLLLRDGRRRVLARGLDGPSFAALRDGVVYVSEFGAGRVSRLRSNAAAVEVADPAGISFAADGSLLIASLDGTITRR